MVFFEREIYIVQYIYIYCWTWSRPIRTFGESDDQVRVQIPTSPRQVRDDRKMSRVRTRVLQPYEIAPDFNAVPHILTDVIKVSAGWYNQQSVSQCFLRFCCFHSISQDYFPYLAWAHILHQYLRAFILSFTDEGRCRYWNVKTLTRSSEQVFCHFHWVCLLYICQIEIYIETCGRVTRC